MSANKIYKVEVFTFDPKTDHDPLDGNKQIRLVRAKTANRARAFVAESQIFAEPLTIEDARTYAELPIEDVPE